MTQASRHLVTLKCDIALCRPCCSLVLAGTSEGLTIRVDPYPVERAVEAAAIIAGRWTYTLTWSRHLVRRTGGTHRGPVLVEHRCGQPLTPTTSPPSNSKPDSDDCPY